MDSRLASTKNQDFEFSFCRVLINNDKRNYEGICGFFLIFCIIFGDWKKEKSDDCSFKVSLLKFFED